jgi:hypothetical protein
MPPVRLQEALQKAGVAHEFVVPGGGHGNFAPDQWQRAYATVKSSSRNVPAAKAPSSPGRP